MIYRKTSNRSPNKFVLPPAYIRYTRTGDQDPQLVLETRLIFETRLLLEVFYGIMKSMKQISTKLTLMVHYGTLHILGSKGQNHNGIKFPGNTTFMVC